MAMSTANTILKYASSKTGPFTKLVDITNYPDFGSTPNKLDTTDLSQTKYRTSILGLQDIPDLTFEANYDLEAYKTISAMSGTYWFNVEFGTDGEDGIFEWSGNIAIYLTGGGVDEVRKMTIVLSAETPIEVKSTP